MRLVDGQGGARLGRPLVEQDPVSGHLGESEQGPSAGGQVSAGVPQVPPDDLVIRIEHRALKRVVLVPRCVDGREVPEDEVEALIGGDTGEDVAQPSCHDVGQAAAARVGLAVGHGGRADVRGQNLRGALLGGCQGDQARAAPDLEH